MNLVVNHSWYVKPSVADELITLMTNDPAGNGPGRDYASYGLDISATEGGCGTLVGVATSAAGMTDASTWKISKLMPYAIPKASFGTNPATANWGQQAGVVDGTEYRTLSYYDPSIMSLWMKGHATPSFFNSEATTLGGPNPWRQS